MPFFEAVAQHFSAGLAEGLGAVFAYLIFLIFIVFAATLLLGLFSFGIALFFARRKKAVPFLVFALLATLLLPFPLSIICFSQIQPLVGIVIYLALFITGLIISVQKFRTLKR